jgi:hypothetical protein
MPQPKLLKTKQIARDGDSVLYEKSPGVWISTCPSCGMEHDVSGEVIDTNKLPECCGWAWRLFDKLIYPPKYDPAWIRSDIETGVDIAFPIKVSA